MTIRTRLLSASLGRGGTVLLAALLPLSLLACKAPPPPGGEPLAAGEGEGEAGVEGEGEGAPQPAVPGEGELDGPCYQNNTCNPGLRCSDGTCTQPPRGDPGGACFGNGTCNDPNNCVGDICVAPAPDPEGTPFGEPCQDHPECRGEFCVNPAAGGAKRCSRLCAGAEDCPNGWDCRNLSVAGGDQAFVCMPPPTACTACETADNCGGAPTYECLNAWGGTFCGFRCGDGDQRCPPRYTCTSFGLPEERCIPAIECTGDPKHEVHDLKGLRLDGVGTKAEGQESKLSISAGGNPAGGAMEGGDYKVKLRILGR